MNHLLTGCASGIGKHLTGALAARGDRVYATDVDLDRLRAAAREDRWPEDRVVLARLDVRDPGAWERALDEATKVLGGRIDVLMNIAGYLRAAWVQDITVEDVHRHYDVNVKGLMFGTIAAARRMAAAGGGQILNFSSLSGIVPLTGLAAYSSSKFAVRGFSLAAAQELKPKGVYVTLVSPDGTRTPMTDFAKQGAREAELIFSRGKLLTVEDVTRVVLERALPKRPLEVGFPRWRAWLSHFASLLPGLAFRLEPIFRRRGAETQKKMGMRAGA
jgi:3-oxoacyl-[acyl-carrier protein] reductase